MQTNESMIENIAKEIVYNEQVANFQMLNSIVLGTHWETESTLRDSARKSIENLWNRNLPGDEEQRESYRESARQLIDIVNCAGYRIVV